MIRNITFPLLVLLGIWSGACRSQLVIYPPAPRLLETVRVQAPEGVPTSEILDLRATKVSMDGNKITVSLVSTGTAPTLPEPSPPIDVPVGQFPAGNYQVEVRAESQTGTVLRILGAASFSVVPKSREDPLWNLTDLWWNPDESGWGINIVQHPSGIIFATWFVYGSDGRATWYVVPEGRWGASGTGYVGPVYRTTGPEFCYQNQSCAGPAFDPRAVTRTLVGEASISIDPNNYDRAILTITVDGKTLTRHIQRHAF